MPMYVKLDIGQRGNIEAQIKYSKRDSVDFDNCAVTAKERTVANVFSALAKKYRGFPIEKSETESKPAD